jgi:hypothetical protein
VKQLKSVSGEGIHYIDEDGNLQFIDFKVCNQNWMKHQGVAPDGGDEWDRKCVGWRDYSLTPPCIYFCTEPGTRFEFNPDYSQGHRDVEYGFYELMRLVRRARWWVVDMS